ncbi:MAG: tetratricopeptide repeat protein [Planctomycetota bacterium]|jgi:hypothetical protein
MRTGTRSEKSKVRSFAFCLFTSVFIFNLHSVGVLGQHVRGSDTLFSPSVGQKFYEIAYELGNREDISTPTIEQAIVFLNAAAALDNTTNYALPEIIKLASRETDHDHAELILSSLDNYISETADLEVITNALQYLLDRLDSREQREQFLEFVLTNVGGRNSALDSQLLTLLGLLKAETADDPNTAQFLIQAYNKNKYNKLAFSKMAELMGEQITPATYLEQLRLVVGENPLNLEAALAFAEYAEQLQLYRTASDAYQYCTEVFSYLYPSQPLPAWLYMPWSMSNYNTQRNQYKCLQIARDVRQSGRFDLFVEAIAGKAAAKIGDAEQAARLFRQAEEKALNLLSPNISSGRQGPVTTEQIAWFYCFVLADPDRAIDWANKAYSVDPNSMTAAILAYSLVMNEQNQWAKSVIDNYEKTTISELALAQIQLAEGQKPSAFETLKLIIAQDPGSFEAERAKQILADNGGEYISTIDPGIVLKSLTDSFKQAIVPAFIRPENLISVELNVRGSKFSYGSKFGGSVAITNNSFEPLVVSDDGLFTGSIRVDADISGDLNEKIPNVVSTKIHPALPVESGQSLVVPLKLTTSKFKQILLKHPQASLDIEFTAYIDPVTTSEGQVVNRLVDVKPAKVRLKRPSKKLTAKFLQNELNSISSGRQGQKTKIAQLFAGLLMEQHAMANREPLYKFMYADWMPELLKSALLHSLADDDWVVKVKTMAALLDLPMDYDMIDAVSKSLNDTHWPSRIMALYLLTVNQGSSFVKVLDYSAQYDTNELVREMAIALGGVRPEPQKSTEQPSSESNL